MCFFIRWKLILSIVGPVILIAVFGMKATIDVIQSTINIRLHEQATESARNYATKLDAGFRPIAQVARNTAVFLEAVPDLDEAELFTLLRANIEQNPLIYGSAIAYVRQRNQPVSRRQKNCSCIFCTSAIHGGRTHATCGLKLKIP